MTIKYRIVEGVLPDGEKLWFIDELNDGWHNLAKRATKELAEEYLQERVARNHKHYDAAKRAYYNTSFSPEKRAVSECNYFDAIMAEFEQLGVSDDGKAKFERLFLLSLAAKSRCASSMITGAANFPVARIEKANNRERKISDELLAYVERVRKAIEKQNNPQNHAISSDDNNALQMLRDKLTALQSAQDKMKLVNKIVRDKQLMKLERIAEVLGSKEAAENILKPDFCNRVGFASFSLTNNNATIKATEQRIKELERAAARVTRELAIAGVRVVENAEENRVQFFFDGKPQQSIINLMKSNGFKWTPSKGCWGRMWNNNAIWAVNHYIIPELKKLNSAEAA